MEPALGGNERSVGEAGMIPFSDLTPRSSPMTIGWVLQHIAIHLWSVLSVLVNSCSLCSFHRSQIP